LFTPNGLFGHSAAQVMALFRLEPQQLPQMRPPSAEHSRFAPLPLHETHVALFINFPGYADLKKNHSRKYRYGK
jgi:hypothetical protein